MHTPSSCLLSSRPSVSIIIPVYREEEHVAETITDVVAGLRETQFRFEVIVILDSEPGDRTGFIVHEMCKRLAELRLIERSGKRGVGNAIIKGLKEGKGSIFVPLMGDHSESSADLIKLVEGVAQGYDLSVADRFQFGKPNGYPIPKYIANRCFNYFIKLLFGTSFSDITNAFKAYNARVLEQLNLTSSGFEIFAELPLKVTLMRPDVKIISVPTQHFVRKKRFAKLSLLRGGSLYIRVAFSLFLSVLTKKKLVIRAKKT